MNKPEFTREQEDFICLKIDEWYLLWNDRIGLREHINGVSYKFGIAKEHLKEWLCGEKKDNTDINKELLLMNIYDSSDPSNYKG